MGPNDDIQQPRNSTNFTSSARVPAAGDAVR